jgi:hypothetical protein
MCATNNSNVIIPAGSMYLMLLVLPIFEKKCTEIIFEKYEPSFKI